MTKFYVDNMGLYLGGFDGAEPPKNSIEVSNPPEHGSQIWSGSEWGEIPHVAAELSSIEFFALFEDEELAIEEASEKDAMIRIFLRWATGADVINMDHEKVTDGLGYLVKQKLLTETRRDEILAS